MRKSVLCSASMHGPGQVLFPVLNLRSGTTKIRMIFMKTRPPLMRSFLLSRRLTSQEVIPEGLTRGKECWRGLMERGWIPIQISRMEKKIYYAQGTLTRRAGITPEHFLLPASMINFKVIFSKITIQVIRSFCSQKVFFKTQSASMRQESCTYFEVLSRLRFTISYLPSFMRRLSLTLLCRIQVSGQQWKKGLKSLLAAGGRITGGSCLRTEAYFSRTWTCPV